jgi:hypothetical protein
LTAEPSERWTKDAWQSEKEAQQATAWDLHLDCLTQREIAEQVGVTHPTVAEWLGNKAADAANLPAPESRQHFDVWNVGRSDKDSGQQSLLRRAAAAGAGEPAVALQ